jgi:pimeloyl-ACP methyl ester carboxylesterase
MESTASKPLALLIPGLDGTGELFFRQRELLAGEYRVLAWNYGKGGDFTLHDLASRIGAATAGEPPASILVAAESFGGLVALDYVLTYPERVRRLILVNAFPYYRRRRRLWLACRLAPLLQVEGARRLKNKIVDAVLSREGIRPEDRARFLDIVTRVDHAGYRRRLQLIRESDMRPKLPQIAVPTVILAAHRDKLVPSVAEARLMKAQIRDARLHEFPAAGHALMLTPGISLLDYW